MLICLNITGLYNKRLHADAGLVRPRRRFANLNIRRFGQPAARPAPVSRKALGGLHDILSNPIL